MAEQAGAQREANRLGLEALQVATQQLVQLSAELAQHARQRASNASPDRPTESALRDKDSSIKRNTALIKKIKGISQENEAALIKECEAVNQAKYVSEVADALAEAPKRPADVGPALSLATSLHLRYAEFSGAFVQGLSRAYGVGTKPVAGSEEERSLVKRRRAVLRLAAEALLLGLIPAKDGLAILQAMLQDLSMVKWEQDPEGFTRALTLLAVFAKSPVREALLGQPPQPPQLPVEPTQLQQGDVPPGLDDSAAAAWSQLRTAWADWQQATQAAWTLGPTERAGLVKVVDRMFSAACSTLVSEHQALKTLEADNARIITQRGDLSAESAAEYQRKRQGYEGLQRALVALSEALHRPMPDLPEDTFTRLEAADGIKQVQPSGADANQAAGLWDDAESAAFYESLPDIKSLVPAVLLGLKKPDKKAGKDAADTPPEASPEKVPSDGGTEPERSTSSATNLATTAAATTTSASTAGDMSSASAAAGESAESAEAAARASHDGAAEGAAGGEGEGEADGEAGASRGQADVLMHRLPTCVSKDLIDEVIVAWCFHNSKTARKRLIRALCELPRGVGMPLIPFYARATAILAQVFPDVPTGVISHLEAEFKMLLNKKDSTQASLEPRLRNARYLAELCKFRLYPAGSFFVSLKALLDEFGGLNVDAAVAMVEGAGRFLLRVPETQQRMENMLEVMNRLKNARGLDSRQAALVDGAYYAAKAPKGGFNAARRKRRPPLQEYIRHLIFEELNDTNLRDVLPRLLKLPWVTCEQYVLKCMMKVVRGRAANIPLVVSLAYALNKFYESLGVALVDGVLEAIRDGVEHPGYGTYQKRMADVRLLGELYNYMLCDSVPVFEALYLLVLFGHDDPAAALKLDPPTDYFRVRLVVTLLSVCGRYFKTGKAGARLDRFLVFFQAYFLSKVQPLPLDVEFDLEDVLHALRPQLERPASFTEAAAALNTLLTEEAKAGGAAALGFEEGGDEEDERLISRQQEEEEEGQEVVTSGDGEEEGEEEGLGLDDRGEEEEVDEEFEKELAALTGEAGRSAGLSAGGPSAQQQQQQAEDGSTAAGEAAAAPMITFKMLMKKGGRDDKSKELQVPSDTRIAAAVAARQAAEEQERQQLKKLVLAANKQQEDEQRAIAKAEMLRHGYKPRGRGGGQGGGGGERGAGGGVGAGGAGGPSTKRAGHVPTSLY